MRAMTKTLAITLSILCLAAAHAETDVLRCTRDMENVSEAAARQGVAFDIRGTLTGLRTNTADQVADFLVNDKTGTTVLGNRLCEFPAEIRPGDYVRARGVIRTQGRGIYAKVSQLDVLKHQPAESPAPVRLADLATGLFDGRPVILRGRVTNVFPDEVDRSWLYLVLSDGALSVYAPIVPSQFGVSDGDELLGAQVELTGWSHASSLTGARVHLGRVFATAAGGLKILERPKTDLFSSPPLESCRQLAPAEIAGLGRRRTTGRVIAAERRGRFYLKTDDGRCVRVDLAKPPAPAFGQVVDAVGTPETDLYHVNLSAARWRPSSETAAPPETEATPVRARDLLVNADGQSQFNTRFHGRPVRIRGLVRSLPSADDPNGRLYLEDGGFLVPVDFGALPDALRDVQAGCRVEVSGTCIFESENWRPNATFPRISNLVVVGRTPGDLTVLARPPWWTPRRFLVLVGALALVILAVGAGNVSLRALVERRSRALNREAIARVTSDLKVYERTRLAVELHDSIAQSLTGVSLEIRTARRLAQADAAAMQEHLDMATKTLDSCRQELRNCLWDLRNHALEQADMETAIRQTLKPVLGGASLSVRFPVPRARLSDNTAHAILRIVRELATNAVRHGRAASVKVAGGIEGDRLLFSVRDDGSGFDPSRAPGAEQGHFGLQGVRERILTLGGAVQVDSAPGRGARIALAIPLRRKPSPDEGESESHA